MTINITHVKLWLAAFVLSLVCSVPALSAASASSNAILGEIPLVALGPAAFKEGRLTVNGQIIVRDNHTEIATENESASTRIRQGDYLAVAGDLMGSGRSLATTILILDEDYVDGSSPTYLRAQIDSASSTGKAYSSESVIDLGPSLFQTNISGLGRGDIAEFSGISVDGLLIASETSLVERGQSITSGRLLSSVRGARGTGVRGARGTGVRGARGTGVRGARGTGVRGARGTGVRGARGTGVRGARGTGVRGARGTGVRGARGTGVRGARGTGVRGARGTGVRGARGTGVRGARGTGVRGARGTGVRGARGTGVRGARGTGVRGARGTGVR